MGVELRNAQRSVPVDAARLKRVAQRLLEALSIKEAELSILLTDDRQIAKLNERWMRRRGPTDVLSFPQQASVLRIPAPEGGSQPPKVLGDIVISVETAARSRPGDLFGEVVRLLVHGLLHLVGYDHAQVGQHRKMEAKARKLQVWLTAA